MIALKKCDSAQQILKVEHIHHPEIIIIEQGYIPDIKRSKLEQTPVAVVQDSRSVIDPHYII